MEEVNLLKEQMENYSLLMMDNFQRDNFMVMVKFNTVIKIFMRDNFIMDKNMVMVHIDIKMEIYMKVIFNMILKMMIDVDFNLNLVLFIKEV